MGGLVGGPQLSRREKFRRDFRRHFLRRLVAVDVQQTLLARVVIDGRLRFLLVGLQLPDEALAADEGAYYAVRIQSDDARKTVTVYLRNRSGVFKVAGAERTW